MTAPETTDGGCLIVLHGASSAGKSTLSRALLPRLPVPFWHLSIDHLRDGGVWRMGAFTETQRWRDHRARYFAGFHACVTGAVAAGNAVLLEHVLDTPGWHATLAEGLAGADVFFVALMTRDDALRSREAARGDRPTGSALRDAQTIHTGRRYDLTLDGTAPPEANAATLLRAWTARRAPSAFFEVPDAPPVP